MPRLDLSRLRFLIDSRSVGSTKNSRTSNILAYLYEVSQESIEPEDPFFMLSGYLPSVSELPAWISQNESVIDALKRQDARDYHTERYDLDEETAQFSESSWLYVSHEACRIMSLNPELERANIALKLLYLGAHNDRLEALHSIQQDGNRRLTDPAA